MLFVFGDSWAAGAELEDGEKPFAFYLASLLEQPRANLARHGMSLGHIMSVVLENVDKINETDYVVVIVPPDVRWYEIDDDFKFKSLSIHTSDYIKNYNHAWFIYHHSLFIYTIYSAITSRTKNLILAHNYGKLVIPDTFSNLIDRNYFLSDYSLTHLLIDDEIGDAWDNYNFQQDGPWNDMFRGKYFEGKKQHPNHLGHKQIAKMLYKKFKTL